MKVMFFGYGGNSFLAEELRPVITELSMQLVTIHEWPSADIKWDRNTWKSELQKADIIIIPANYRVQPAKSNNRLTQALALGKPVICSPLPAYLKVAEKHPSAFLVAHNEAEWKEFLTKLRDSEELRGVLSKNALIAAQDYSIDAMGKKWLSVLTQRDATDIVIPTYKNLRGLKLCIDSIKACTDTLYNIIVVNNGTDEALHQYLDGRGDIVYTRIPKCNFAQAVNQGIALGKSKYVCILNDDVIVSKGWLKGMIDECKGDVGIVGVLSNCDYGWLHKQSLNIGGVELLPGMNTFEQIEPIIPQIYEFTSPDTGVYEREWVAYYCNLIPRVVIEKAGVLNEEFTNSGEDVDHCRRIRKQGYRIVQNFKSFVFHFGAVSRRLLELEDRGSYQEADRKTNLHLRDLWDKKSVLIYSGPSFEKWDHRNAEIGGVGGSEIWQIMLSRELSKLGYRVTCFADCLERSMDSNVEWLPYTDYNRCVEQHWYDYAILSRTTDPLRLPLRAGKVFVLSHDLWLLSAKEQMFMDRVEKFCCLSEWHRDFFSEHHRVPKDKIIISSNGIDFSRFDVVTDVERNPYRFHYSSSWDRGLDNLLYLWPFIREKIPEAELHVYYGCHTWKAACLQRNDVEGLKKIADIEKAMEQPGVYNHGRLGQQDLAVEIKKASILLYPQWFSETFYVGGIEAQYAGVPVICNRYAGVTTTFKHPEIGDTAIMLGNGDAWWPYSKEGREAFLNETVSLLTDKEKWALWSNKGKENAKRYSWADVAKSWKGIFDG